MANPTTPTWTVPPSDPSYDDRDPGNDGTMPDGGHNVVTEFGADPTGAASSRSAVWNAISTYGGTGEAIWFPAGTYKMTTAFAQTMPNVPSNTVIMGVPGETTLSFPDMPDTATYSFVGEANASNVVIDGFHFTTPDRGPVVAGDTATWQRLYGPYFTRGSNIRLSRLSMENMRQGIRVSGVEAGYLWTTDAYVNDISMTNMQMGMYVGWIYDSTFKRIRIQGSGPGSAVANTDHAWYIGKGTHNCTFDDLEMFNYANEAYALQIQGGLSVENRCTDLTFNRMRVNHETADSKSMALYLIQHDNVTINDYWGDIGTYEWIDGHFITGATGSADGAGFANFTLNRFQAMHGPGANYLFCNTSGVTIAGPVALTNGKWSGTNYMHPSPGYQDVTMTNVSQGTDYPVTPPAAPIIGG